MCAIAAVSVDAISW